MMKEPSIYYKSNKKIESLEDFVIIVDYNDGEDLIRLSGKIALYACAIYKVFDYNKSAKEALDVLGIDHVGYFHEVVGVTYHSGNWFYDEYLSLDDPFKYLMRVYLFYLCKKESDDILDFSIFYFIKNARFESYKLLHEKEAYQFCVTYNVAIPQEIKEALKRKYGEEETKYA